MTDVYLVRHGATEWSTNGRHTSTTDLPLTEQGREQAEKLRHILDSIPFGMVLVSPRKRAQETAQLSGFGPGKVTTDNDLSEWNYGNYEGLTTEQIQQERPGWSLGKDGAPGGENPQEIRDRMQHLIDYIESSGAERVICFGHGHALRALTCVWLGFDFDDLDKFPLDTGTVSILSHYRQSRSLKLWNWRAL